MTATRTTSAIDARERLQHLIMTLSHIRKATGTPSFSAGVLHRGEVIFIHSEGLCDVDAQKPKSVNLDTVYLIGSLTKAFISASCGILVKEGKLNWNAPISDYLPFKQVNDPVISSRATLLDALSHSTGFPQIDISWYGAQGETIIPADELLHIVNNLPVYPDFRAKFHYTNWMYALAGRIIEKTGGKDAAHGWGSFLKNRIFKPLDMSRSCSNRRRLPDSNFAEPHMALDSCQPGRLPIPDFSDETLTGASAAVWSTVPDMLKWAAAILERLSFERQPDSSSSSFGTNNPLRQISTILSHRFRVTEDTINENSYGLGWARHVLPSTHLGWLSTNGPQTKHILGRESRPRLILYHGGQITGYLNSIYLDPETQSAVVVLTNAQGAGDCSDWIAQALLQSLFELKPALDFGQLADENAREQLNAYEKMKAEYERHRKPGTPALKMSQVLGLYRNESTRMTINVQQDDSGLFMELNGRISQRHRLSHYADSIYGFLPASREEQQRRCLVDYFVYDQFLIRFTVEGDGNQARGLSWMMQEDFEPLFFERRDSS